MNRKQKEKLAEKIWKAFKKNIGDHKISAKQAFLSGYVIAIPRGEGEVFKKLVSNGFQIKMKPREYKEEDDGDYDVICRECSKDK